MGLRLRRDVGHWDLVDDLPVLVLAVDDLVVRPEAMEHAKLGNAVRVNVHHGVGFCQKHEPL